MKTVDWSVADDFAAGEGLYVHFRNFETYLLARKTLCDKRLSLHLIKQPSRAPPNQ